MTHRPLAPCAVSARQLSAPVATALPAPAGAAHQALPFCSGSFLACLPRRAPVLERSWCDRFAGCFGYESARHSAIRTAYRQLLALLARLPQTVPGNPVLQEGIDGLQQRIGLFRMTRHQADSQAGVLDEIIGFCVSARSIGRKLEHDYQSRWKPANRVRPALFDESRVEGGMQPAEFQAPEPARRR